MTSPDSDPGMVSNGQTWSTGQSVNKPLSWSDTPPVNVGTVWTDPTGGVPLVEAGPLVDLGNGMSRELISADFAGERWETWAYRARRGNVLVLLPVAGAELADPATAAAYDDMMRTALAHELDRRTSVETGGLVPNRSVWQSTSTEYAGDCDIAATAVWDTPPPDPAAVAAWQSLLDDPSIAWLSLDDSELRHELRQARYRLRWQMVTPEEHPDLYTGDIPNRPADQVPDPCWDRYTQHHIDGGLLLEQWAQLHQATAAGELIRDVHMYELDPDAPDGWREIDAGGPTP